ncbi:MAG: vanadium-dependent haloperoxidase [Chitinophagaceae bacterium]
MTETKPVQEDMILPASLANLTNVIIRDIYSPPVASRIYAYAQLAFYEGVRFEDTTASSITAGLKGFDPMPVPEAGKKYDFTLAGLTAFYTVGRKLVFSKDSLNVAEQRLTGQYRSALPSETFTNSVQLGNWIAEVILRRSKTDNYDKSRGMPRFSVYKTDGKWRQTSPDYADAVEPYWSTISPLLLDSASQFKPLPPPEYSLNKNSRYYTELMEVYEVTRYLTPTQDSIATYWDDNAFVTRHEGHLMYANKKTTPVGHWMGITSILCTLRKTSIVKSAKVYALTACVIFDGFISCWDEKFRSSTVRPITVIQQEFDQDWESLLQTPSFPEYTSGHSVISSAAATVLTAQLGNNISFTDTTEMDYMGLKRQFPSVEAAAAEAGISRLYGGIHFRSAITEGSRQGIRVGSLYNSRFQ